MGKLKDIPKIDRPRERFLEKRISNMFVSQRKKRIIEKRNYIHRHTR